MVEHVARALLLREPPSLLRPGRAYDFEARGARQLQSGRADAAARAGYEERPRPAPSRALEERAVSRRVRREDARALRERDALGQRVNLRLVAQRKLGVRARQTPRGVD